MTWKLQMPIRLYKRTFNAIVTIDQPTEISVATESITDIDCFGENTGAIDITPLWRNSSLRHFPGVVRIVLPLKIRIFQVFTQEHYITNHY